MKFDVVGLGGCAADFSGIIPGHPSPDAKVQLLESSQQGGGPVATALVTLARLGSSCGFIGSVGDDELGFFEVREFKKEGVDITHLKMEKGKRSLFAFLAVDKATGKRIVFRSRPETSDLKPEELDKEYVTSGKILHLDGFHPKAALTAARWARESGIKVVLDPSEERPGLDEIIKETDCLIASEVFARKFAGGNGISRVAKRLTKLGPEIVVITRGEKGSLCVTGNEEWTTPAFPVKAVDTTGAGDVFHGGFIYGLLLGWPLKRAIIFASAVSALKCRKLGSRAGIPARNEVDRFLEERGVI